MARYKKRKKWGPDPSEKHPDLLPLRGDLMQLSMDWHNGVEGAPSIDELDPPANEHERQEWSRIPGYFGAYESLVERGGRDDQGAVNLPEG